MNKDDYKDPKKRAEHYKYYPGRPTDESIVEAIKKRIGQITDKGYRGGCVFTTEQLTYPLWNDLPHHHHYISQHMTRLIEEYGLPIHWHSVRSDGHVLRTIDLGAL